MPARKKRAPAGSVPSDPKTARGEAGTQAWEWAVAAAGVAILLAMVGYLLWEAVAQPSSGAPDIVISRTEVVPLGGRYLVRFHVINKGNSTGANVAVSGTLQDGDKVIEASRTTIDFVPQHSESEGGLFFDTDPSAYRLGLRIEGYVRP